MIQEAGLRDRGVPGCAEATTTKVNVLALKEEWDGEKELRRDLQGDFQVSGSSSNTTSANLLTKTVPEDTKCRNFAIFGMQIT